MGIETFYPEHSTAQIAAYREMCRHLGLVATGGSDFHGPSVGGARHPGLQPVPASAWRELRSRLESLAAEPKAPAP